MTAQVLKFVPRQQPPPRDGDMQWRGSDDGVTWDPWFSLHQVPPPIPHFVFYQTRVWHNPGWDIGPIVTSFAWW